MTTIREPANGWIDDVQFIVACKVRAENGRIVEMIPTRDYFVFKDTRMSDGASLHAMVSKDKDDVSNPHWPEPTNQQLVDAKAVGFWPPDYEEMAKSRGLVVA